VIQEPNNYAVVQEQAKLQGKPSGRELPKCWGWFKVSARARSLLRLGWHSNIYNFRTRAQAAFTHLSLHSEDTHHLHSAASSVIFTRAACRFTDLFVKSLSRSRTPVGTPLLKHSQLPTPFLKGVDLFSSPPADDTLFCTRAATSAVH
jgi:hypothetical protein